jgi:hypothetical protein
VLEASASGSGRWTFASALRFKNGEFATVSEPVTDYDEHRLQCVDDLLFIPKPADFWSKLQVKAASIMDGGSAGPVGICDPSGAASRGSLEVGLLETAYTGSTRHGFSGAPYTAGKSVLGIHIGSTTRGDVTYNNGVPIGAVLALHKSGACLFPAEFDPDTMELKELEAKSGGRGVGYPKELLEFNPNHEEFMAWQDDGGTFNVYFMNAVKQHRRYRGVPKSLVDAMYKQREERDYAPTGFTIPDDEEFAEECLPPPVPAIQVGTGTAGEAVARLVPAQPGLARQAGPSQVSATSGNFRRMGNVPQSLKSRVAEKRYWWRQKGQGLRMKSQRP